MKLTTRALATGPSGSPLLVVVPSLGTTSRVWEPVAAELSGAWSVLGIELPGHASPLDVDAGAFDVSDLAASVAEIAHEHAEGGPWHLAGLSLGGCVALAAAMAARPPVAATVVCSGAKVGESDAWLARAALVREQGTQAVVAGSRARWFAQGFADAHPEVAEPLLSELEDMDPEGYARCCEALARFDVRDRLGEVTVPVQVIVGDHDVATPPSVGSVVATGVGGPLETLTGVGHLATVEAPAQVARMLSAFVRRFEAGQR